METLETGNRLVVNELYRLGRSLGQVVAILNALVKQEVSFVAIKETIRVEGKQASTASCRILYTCLHC